MPSICDCNTNDEARRHCLYIQTSQLPLPPCKNAEGARRTGKGNNSLITASRGKHPARRASGRSLPQVKGLGLIPS